MSQPPFEQWMIQTSWALSVRYCKVVMWMLPAAALAINAPQILKGTFATAPGVNWLIAWQITVEATCLVMLAIDRWMPRWRATEAALYLFCFMFMLLCTWAGVRAVMYGGTGMAIYAAGMTFISAVICTPLRVRRPMYVLSLLALAAPVWDSTEGDLGAVIFSLVNPFCVVALCIVLDRHTYSRNLELYRQKQIAESERARADEVLCNVLPPAIADELKREGKVAAVKHDNMAVLFADIAGFTRFSRGLPPDALVLVLNQIFSSFDELVARHGLEKIKTIGDGYMVASPDRLPDLCDLALELVQAIEAYNRANGTQLAMRIGINAGPAVAGVLGVARFLYDVWGDTVNVASRMEASGEPGRIHVSATVQRQMADRFAFEQREPVEIKGRGVMQTYWLSGAASAAAQPEGRPLLALVA